MIDWNHFNAADWAIIVIIGLSVLLSLWRGFAREAASLAGWIAAFVLANVFVGEMESFLAPWIENITGRYVAAYAILFAGTLVMAGIVGGLIAQVVRAAGLTFLDRLLGTVFGFARGIIIILVAVYFLRQLAPPQNLVYLDQAQLMPRVDMVGKYMQLLFSQYQSGMLPEPSKLTKQ